LPLQQHAGATLLPYGNGRSYGDSCLNDGGVLIDCRGLDRIISFDAETGILRCEAGVLLADILARIVPQGWFLPVTPGTQYVTLGGSIANDIHGKNHHRAGTFGRHVKRFELARSDGTRQVCSRTENAPLFRATIGGLGLTGVITWADIQLTAVHNGHIDQEVIRFATLDEFFTLSARSSQRWEYTVAWVDSLASGGSLGRGLFIRGNHAAADISVSDAPSRAPTDFPVDPPFPLVNRTSLRVFNTVYFRKQLARSKSSTVPYAGFFYPLDRIGKWYRLYGRRGLLQHQCVLPAGSGADAVRQLLEVSAGSGTGSFLTVLKEFGALASPGLLSFPRPGVTLTLDFPNRGTATLDLLDRLDGIVIQAGGAVNPYKDARMSPQVFQSSFPDWRDFESFIDPRFSSSFWRRVTRTHAAGKARPSSKLQAAQ
jgi:FAD/FMN-containing dehydrogenase